MIDQHYVDILLPLIVALVGAIASKARQWAMKNIAPQQFTMLRYLAEEVIVAAEKLGVATGIAGPEKYAYAEQALTDMAKRVGVRLKTTEANALIHAALAGLDGVEQEQQRVAA